MTEHKFFSSFLLNAEGKEKSYKIRGRKVDIDMSDDERQEEFVQKQFMM